MVWINWLEKICSHDSESGKKSCYNTYSFAITKDKRYNASIIKSPDCLIAYR